MCVLLNCAANSSSSSSVPPVECVVSAQQSLEEALVRVKTPPAPHALLDLPDGVLKDFWKPMHDAHIFYTHTHTHKHTHTLTLTHTHAHVHAGCARLAGVCVCV